VKTFSVLSLADIASIVLAYAFLGRADVVAALRTEPLKKPLWALQPTWAKKLLHGATWPFGHIARAYFKNPGKEARAVAVAIFKVAAPWALMSFMFSLAFNAAAFFHDSAVLRIAVFIVAYNVLLALASWVSPARLAFPLRAPPLRFLK
jgi:hypothetical protein